MIGRFHLALALAALITAAFAAAATRPPRQQASSRQLAPAGAPAPAPAFGPGEGVPAPAPAPAPAFGPGQGVPAPAPSPATDLAPASLPSPASDSEQQQRRQQRKEEGDAWAGGAAPLPPDWVQLGDVEDSWLEGHETNVEAVAQANAQEPPAQLDFVMYGDSITAWHLQKPEPWQEAFGDLAGLPLGMRGSTVESLAWRIIQGGELPAVPPRVALFEIGVNNVYKELAPPTERLDWLLGWLNATWGADTKVALLALLPTTEADVAPTNERYAELASRRGVPLLTCGQEMDPTDGDLFPDGLHPSRVGQERILRCLRDGLAPWLAGGAETAGPLRALR